MEEKKRCSKCRKNKSLDNFFLNKNSKDGHHHYCKLCHNNNSKIKMAVSRHHYKNLTINCHVARFSCSNVHNLLTFILRLPNSNASFLVFIHTSNE